jgi:hypothetical protein
MARRPRLPELELIGDDTLLRLQIAAKLEFPDGSITASGLRGEALKGRLKTWKIAGKQFTSRAALRELREQCLVKFCPPDLSYALIGDGAARPTGSARTRELSGAQATKASAQKLRKHSRSTPRNPDEPPSATVIPIKS